MRIHGKGCCFIISTWYCAFQRKELCWTDLTITHNHGHSALAAEAGLCFLGNSQKTAQMDAFPSVLLPLAPPVAPSSRAFLPQWSLRLHSQLPTQPVRPHAPRLPLPSPYCGILAMPFLCKQTEHILATGLFPCFLFPLVLFFPWMCTWLTSHLLQELRGKPLPPHLMATSLYLVICSNDMSSPHPRCLVNAAG